MSAFEMNEEKVFAWHPYSTSSSLLRWIQNMQCTVFIFTNPFIGISKMKEKKNIVIFSIFLVFCFVFNKKKPYFACFPFLYLSFPFETYGWSETKDKKESNYDNKYIFLTFVYVTFNKTAKKSNVWQNKYWKDSITIWNTHYFLSFAFSFQKNDPWIS